MTANHSLICNEIQKISNRVTTIEEQSPPVVPTPSSNGEQSLSDERDQIVETEQSSCQTTATVTQGEQSSRQTPATAAQGEQSSRQAPAVVAETEQSSHQSLTTVEPLGWGDRPEDETPDYNEEIYWEPMDSDSDSDRHKISPTTAKIVEDAFSHMMTTEKRKGIKRKQPIPDTLFTKVPKLDPTIQSRMAPQAKVLDRNLAGLQGFVLDAAIPLVNILESARSGSLNTRDAAEAAQQALKLLGNASAHISVERRRKASSCLNKELAPLVADEGTFKDAAPYLFGDSFQRKMKDHMEAIRNLKQSLSSYSRHQYFQRSHPPQSRGGGSHRGRGQRKFKPPQTGKPRQ